ncbi:putative methyltransferase At1g29790 [Silene latifolia]|uniref:putative methyltransferase At1g29790 n=1 Tax=Silene latifolia TaxID=37657 RepID=UPI003D77D274
MGSVSLKIGDGTARFKRSSICSSAVNLIMLFSVVTTNLFALYAFTYNNNQIDKNPIHHHHTLISEKVSEIMREIEQSQKKLTQIEQDLLGYETIDISAINTPPELKNFLQRHALPLGKDSRSGITEMTASVGHTCAKSFQNLSNFMNYKVSGQCPGDTIVAEKLLLRGCEPLPRRRCFSKTVNKFGQLYPLPRSLWNSVSDKVVGSWEGYNCNSFKCLSKKLGGNKFDLSRNGSEIDRFVKGKWKNDFRIDDVLGLVGNGDRIRIGFDIGGSGTTGSFAARMYEHNVTVVTQSLDVGGPFNEFIAARGLFPLFMSLDYRFPFYDNLFDLIRIGRELDVGGKPEKMEFLLFDIDRVLRVGGLFWLDNFYCVSEERKRVLTRLIEKFGYKKLKWVVGEKVGGSGKSEVYLSAVLQKPVRA